MTPHPQPNLAHLVRLSDELGIVEHARRDEPARDLGYCTDDAGRLLGVLSAMRDDAAAAGLCDIALAFLEDASDGERGFRLRRRADRTWTDDPRSDDATGRALEGLGIAVARATHPLVRERALTLFERSATWRSHYRRSMSHAALGALSVLEVMPEHPAARALVVDASRVLARFDVPDGSPWPEPRLYYANALIPDARLALAHARGDARGVDDALTMLDWLAREESLGDHFSFTPTHGRELSGVRPDFDQQPIEAWAMADACTRAYRVTGDPRWAARVALARSWFDGNNDVGVNVGDPATGAGYDGLEPTGVNANQGAESTLAFVATVLRSDEIRRALGVDLVPQLATASIAP